MNLGGALTGALGGLLTGGSIGGGIGGIGALLGGGGAGGGLSNPIGQPTYVSARLDGPDFVKAANNVAWANAVGSIGLLEIYPGSAKPIINRLASALSSLKNFFVPGANVFIYIDPKLVTPILPSLMAAVGTQASISLNPSSQQRLQLQQLTQQNCPLSMMNQQGLQNFMFQRAMNEQSESFNTLMSARQAMHDSIMQMLNAAK